MISYEQFLKQVVFNAVLHGDGWVGRDEINNALPQYNDYMLECYLFYVKQAIISTQLHKMGISDVVDGIAKQYIGDGAEPSDWLDDYSYCITEYRDNWVSQLDKYVQHAIATCTDATTEQPFGSLMQGLITVMDELMFDLVWQYIKGSYEVGDE